MLFRHQGVGRVACVVVIVTSLLATETVAQSPDSASAVAQSKEHARRAKVFYERGSYEEALAEYTLAYSFLPLPGLLFNQAQCHRLLGQHAKALQLYERYIAIEPGTATAEEAQGYLPTLRTRIARQESEEKQRQAAAAAARVAPKPTVVDDERAPVARRRNNDAAWEETFERGYRSEGITTAREKRDHDAWFAKRKERGLRAGVHFGFGFGMPTGFEVRNQDERFKLLMYGAQLDAGGFLRVAMSHRWDFVSRLSLTFVVGSLRVCQGPFDDCSDDAAGFAPPGWSGALSFDLLFRVHPHRSSTYPYFGFGTRLGFGFTSIWYTPKGGNESDAVRLSGVAGLFAPVLEVGGIVGRDESVDIGLAFAVGTGGPGSMLYADVMLRVAYAIK